MTIILYHIKIAVLDRRVFWERGSRQCKPLIFRLPKATNYFRLCMYPWKMDYQCWQFKNCWHYWGVRCTLSVSNYSIINSHNIESTPPCLRWIKIIQSCNSNVNVGICVFISGYNVDPSIINWISNTNIKTEKYYHKRGNQGAWNW